MELEIKKIEETALLEISGAKTIEDIENIKVKYLGKKGELTNILKQMGSLSPEERKVVGVLANKVRNDIENSYIYKKTSIEMDLIKEKMEQETIDISISNKGKELGKKHPITKVLDELKEIFIGMGYEIKEGPEIEKAEINFDKLNTPIDHPARDLQDTFYITEETILRTQTSPVQIRTMMNEKPPIKMICPGRVYRSDEVDATHSPMFHQLEGLVVDKNITMSDLKGTLEMFAKKYFGESTKIRLRPHHFPFTEPSAEVDVTCFVCGGKGCRVCKNEGYIEILGAGMVHPNVLKNSGIDPEIYSGFAFGFGIDRIAMTKYAITDLRYLFENDDRFLKQF